MAASKGYFEIVKFLVETEGSPIDLNARDDNEETPLHKAARLNREAVLVYLIERCDGRLQSAVISTTAEGDSDACSL